MFRQDRTNPSTAVSNWKGRRDSKKGHPQTAVSTWLNGGLFGPTPFDHTYKGYFMGGNAYQYDEWVRIFYYANDTVVQSADNLNATPYGGDGTNGTNGTKGYNYHSQDAAPTYTSGKFDRITYATDATDVVTEIVESPTRAAVGCCFNDGTAFYAMGGSTTNYRSEVDKFTQPGESRSQISDTLSQGSAHCCGASDSTTSGFRFGGYSGSASAVIDKIAFSDDCITTVSDTLEEASYWLKATSNYDGRKGYISHGTAGEEVDKMDYTNDTISALSTPFTNTGHACYITDNGVAMYCGGGVGMLGSIQKMVYATETITLVVDDTMPESAQNMTGCENHESSV